MSDGKRKRTPMRGTFSLEEARRWASCPGVKVAIKVASDTSVSAAFMSVEVKVMAA